MIIKKRCIQSVDKYFGFIPEDIEIYICVAANQENRAILKSKRLIQDFNVGQRIVPKRIGPKTRYNIDGKYIVHKDQKKEKRTFEREYHVVDWHGEDHYGTCYQTRLCYPREYIAPPLESIIFDKELIRSDLVYKKEEDRLKHIVNLFLEIFGYCEVVNKDDKPVNKTTEVKTVQWKILPPGKYPWDKAEKELQSFFSNLPNKNRRVMQERHKKIAEAEPDFLAIGEDSFNGYVVYGYSLKNLYIFESNEINNATYVFRGDWKEVSQLTKRDIIQGNLCFKRLIHIPGWKDAIEELMNIE